MKIWNWDSIVKWQSTEQGQLCLEWKDMKKRRTVTIYWYSNWGVKDGKVTDRQEVIHIGRWNQKNVLGLVIYIFCIYMMIEMQTQKGNVRTTILHLNKSILYAYQAALEGSRNESQFISQRCTDDKSSYTGGNDWALRKVVINEMRYQFDS